jgi:hypothetical protein
MGGRVACVENIKIHRPSKIYSEEPNRREETRCRWKDNIKRNGCLTDVECEMWA